MTGALLVLGLLVCGAWLMTEAPSSVWRRRLVEPSSAAPRGQDPETPGLNGNSDDETLLLELSGALLEAGLGIERCLQILGDCSTSDDAARLRGVSTALALGADWDVAWRTAGHGTRSEQSGEPRKQPRALGWFSGRPSRSRMPVLSGLRRYLGFAALSGAPAAGTLYAGASAERRRRHREAQRRAAALGVRLVLPLGLCSLPSFVCLGIIPVVLALLPGGA